MKTFYSYLVDREKKLSRSLSAGRAENGELLLAKLYKTEKMAKKARDQYVRSFNAKPGLIVKITLEALEYCK